MMRSWHWTSASLAVLIAGVAALPQAPATSTPPPGIHRIAGTIVDGMSGVPLGKTRVLLAPTDDRTRIRTVITAAGGKFVFENLPPGKYSLMAERHGFPTQPFEMHEAYGTAIVAGQGQDTEHLVFRLKPAASIDGRVLDGFGDPVRNASIRLFYSSVQGGAHSIVPSLRTLETNDQGMYQAQGLLAGEYFIAVSAKPWFAVAASSDDRMNSSVQHSGLDVAYPFTFFPGVTDWHAATPINLKFGQKATANFTMQTLPALHVRISTGDRGRPTTKLFLHPFDETEIELGTEQIQQTDGDRQQQSIEITGIAPGEYRLQLSFPDGRTIRSEVNWTSDASLSLAQFSDAPTEAIISGAILFDGKTTVPTKADLVLQSRTSRAIYQTSIAADGSFKALHVPPGTYEVHVANAADFFVWGISANAAQVSGTLLEIQNARPLRLSVVATRSLGTIKGFATKNGTAAPGCMVVLVPGNLDNRALYRRDQSDSDGSFFLRSVLPGDYVVFAVSDWDIEWSKPETAKKYLGTGTIVHVTGDQVERIEVNVQ